MFQDVSKDSDRSLEDSLRENPNLVIERLEKLVGKRKVIDVDEDVVEVEVAPKIKTSITKAKT